MTIKEKIKKDLTGIKKVFNKCNIPFVLLWGNCLGCVRHGDIMDWDTDIDIGVFIDISKDSKQNLHEELENVGFKSRKSTEPFFVFFRNVRVDLGYFHLENKMFVAKAKRTYEYDEKFFSKPKEVDFLGDVYLIPNHVEEYLTLLYSDWQNEVHKDRKDWLKIRKKRLGY